MQNTPFRGSVPTRKMLYGDVSDPVRYVEDQQPHRRVRRAHVEEVVDHGPPDDPEVAHLKNRILLEHDRNKPAVCKAPHISHQGLFPFFRYSADHVEP